MGEPYRYQPYTNTRIDYQAVIYYCYNAFSKRPCKFRSKQAATLLAKV